ncbi:uncharacterized protein LOC127750833 [Frankliniella occidentalis]|uniref:Uncharacterized protein LOC127750833 n=1 Tax=Frankliniella occidentalis TaxID=133901 RepID=A0A9C6X572_FRAOC|nr:uncharacterized protein LOC127750833 [Frankliniella occidentalis]
MEEEEASVRKNSSGYACRGIFFFAPEKLEKKKRGLDAQYCFYKKQSDAEKNKWPYFEAMHHLASNKWPIGFKSVSKFNNKINDSADTLSDEGAVGGSNGGKEFPCDIYSEETAAATNILENEEETAAATNILENEEQLGKVWGTLESDKALLEEVHEAKEFFVNRPLLKNTELFAHVAMKLGDRGYFIDQEKAHTRYKGIILRFNEESDKINDTGGAGCKWPLFDMVYELEKDSVTTKAKVTISAGAKANITRASQCVENLKAGRKRAPTDNRQLRLKKVMGGDVTGPPKANPLALK